MKNILILMLILCFGVVSAYDSGEYYYEQGSYFLSVGDVENARSNFEQAKSYLYGEQLSYVEDVLDTLNRVQSKNTKTLLLGDNWYFMGEINDENVITHIYYDSYGNNAIHSITDGKMEVSELENIVSFSSKNFNEIYGYESSTIINNGVSSYMSYWYCENTDKTNIIFLTYYGDKPSLFDNDTELCPTSNYWIYIVLVIVVVGVIAYFVLNKNQNKKKKTN